MDIMYTGPKVVTGNEVENVFNSFIAPLGQGYIFSGHQDAARHMAKRWGFPTERVDEAERIGYGIKFDTYKTLIKLGATHLYEPARALIDSGVNFIDPEAALGELEVALEAGKEEEL